MHHGKATVVYQYANCCNIIGQCLTIYSFVNQNDDIFGELSQDALVSEMENCCL